MPIRNVMLLGAGSAVLLAPPALAEVHVEPERPRGAEDRGAADEAALRLAAGDEEGVETIVVKGQKIERGLQDTAASVAVYDAETIDRQNFIDLYDVISQTANVASVLDESGFAIRGQRNIGAAGGDGTSDVAAVYVDGVFIPSGLFATSPINLWDVEAVEIFRGPQSTIQGRNALAGAIVIDTADPTFDVEGAAQASYAQFDSLRGSAAFGAPIVEDQIAFRVSVDYTRSDGFVDNPTLDTDEADEDETTTARAKLLFRPDALPGLTAIASYGFINAREGEQRVEDDLFPERRVTFEDVQTDLASRSHIVSLDVAYDIDERWSLAAVGAFIDTGFLERRDVDRGSEPLVAGLATDFDSNDRIFSQEIRAQYRGERFEGFLGGYFFDGSNEFETANTTVAETDFAFPQPEVLADLIFGPGAGADPALTGQAAFIRSTIVGSLPNFLVDFAGDSTRDIRNVAIFGEAAYEAFERLTLTFGARLDFEEVDQRIVDSLTVRDFPPLGEPQIDAVLAAAAETFSNQVTIVGDNDFNAFLPKIAATYDWTANVATSAVIQRAYRAGGVSVNTFRAAQAADADGDGDVDQADLEALGIVNAFDPEFTWNFELALRSEWWDDRLVVNANAFFIRYRDQQVNQQLTAQPLDTITDNVGASRLFGVEVETFLSPIEGLDLTANFGFTDTEFTDGSTAAAGDLTGNEFAFAPRWTAGFGVRYRHESGLYGNVRFRAQDDAFAQPDNNPTSVNDRFETVDLIAGYEFRDFRAEVFVTNLFDEDYFTFNPIEPNVGAVGAVGDPRVVGGRLVGRF